LTVSYVGARGRRLLTQERILNPTPQLGVLTVGTNRGHSKYDALQVKFTRRLSNGLQALASYTLAESQDNISTDAVPVLPFFRTDPDQDWGPSDFDVRHTFSGGVTYSARRWSFDSIFTARSALPVNVLTGTTVLSTSRALRPDVVAGVPFYVDDATVPGAQKFNRAAFVNPPVDARGNPLSQGTLGRNALRGFDMSQVDVAAGYDVPLARTMTVHLRLEVFNLFNQVNLGPPTNTLNSGLFGQSVRTLSSSYGSGGITGGGLSSLYQVGGPRSVQLAARIQF
jgi:hypothetical protein